MEKLYQTLPILTQSDASILITGETDTGKDVATEAIHQTSIRAGGPFIKINCSALPEALIGSELFGHAEGPLQAPWMAGRTGSAWHTTAPLRERKGDIRILLGHFPEIYRTQLGKRISGFSREALTRLTHYRFAGNVRKLRNIVEFSASMATEPTIGVEDRTAPFLKPVQPPNAR